MALVLALPLMAWAYRPARETLWSPYQKLSRATLAVKGPDGSVVGTCGELVTVNNVTYQSMLDFDPGRRAARPDLYPPAEIPRSHYVLPFRLAGPRGRVLVVGAGAGNDVAGALAAGAWAVDAVEIDPLIAGIGLERHPTRPYASPAVHLTVTDARAFFRQATGPYDLVWFGLLDSHTTPSAYANVRLDHFVYTRESLAEVKRLLDPSGVVVLLFEAETPWIVDRLAGLLKETFGEPPVALWLRTTSACLGWGGLLLVGGSSEALAPVRARAAADPEVAPRVLPPGALGLPHPADQRRLALPLPAAADGAAVPPRGGGGGPGHFRPAPAAGARPRRPGGRHHAAPRRRLHAPRGRGREPRGAALRHDLDRQRLRRGRDPRDDPARQPRGQPNARPLRSGGRSWGS